MGCLRVLSKYSLACHWLFNWPGMGRLFVEMAFAREYAVLMAITMLGAVFVVIGNLLADILYAIVDPRVQLGKKGGTAA